MRIISWNTNGLRATAKLDLFYPLFKKLGGDIVCLQEVKAEKEQLPADIQDVSGFESFFTGLETWIWISKVGLSFCISKSLSSLH